MTTVTEQKIQEDKIKLKISNQLLTKSKYLIGLECPKYLWLVFNDSAQIKKVETEQLRLFEEGKKVGELAKKLFPDGIDLPTDFKENIVKTKEALNKGKCLFEAGFFFKNCFSRADILEPVENEWDIIEVKSGTDVKDIHIHDLSFQKFIYESNGLKIRKCFILHLNNEYVRKGDLEIQKLFVKKDVTFEVNKEIRFIDERIEEMFKIINSDKQSQKAGLFLKESFKKGYHDCINDGCIELPENNVFCLYRGGKLSCELFENNIIHIKDIPIHVKLNGKQQIQKDCEIKKEVFIDKNKIKDFLKELKYPLHFMDFETFNPAIPMFDNTKPYSQIPFQFSLHIVEKEKSEPIHHYFLYEGDSDPRKDFIFELKKAILEAGTIIVYNQPFEISVLKNLAELYPENKNWTDEIQKRIIDLLIPFREFSYYNPNQQGSASIKDVLPALTGKNYEGLEIKKGGTASAEFMKMAYEECPEKEKAKIKENLLNYCKMDTWGEILIITELKKFKR